jgi:hypothetical protein
VWKAKGTAAFSSSKADEDVSIGCSSGEGGKVVDAVEFPATLLFRGQQLRPRQNQGSGK